MGIVEALGGKFWFNIYAGMFLGSVIAIAVFLAIIAIIIFLRK